MQVRQGDLLIETVEKLPKGQRKKAGRILAYGETTGHKHCLEDGNVMTINGETFFELDKPTVLKHEEHGPIELGKGTYKVIRQREWDPLAKKERRVYD